MPAGENTEKLKKYAQAKATFKISSSRPQGGCGKAHSGNCFYGGHVKRIAQTHRKKRRNRPFQTGTAGI
ncbi:MAG: hypothetical protein ACLVLP_12080 [Phascolarctobacterium faecium]|uniref:hypothetical protein n=1 Tax=Phascolarctobacterium faecium TaxID=33025 RepID=UPI00399A0DBF